MSINVSVNTNVLNLLSAIAASSLFGTTNVRVLAETLGKAGEVNKLVRAAAKEGLVEVTDTVYTRSFKRGNRNITEEIPTKAVKLTEAGQRLNTLVDALNNGRDGEAANIMRQLIAEGTTTATVEEETVAVEKPAKAKKVKKAA
jgi:hypothetical protein